tara:strand:- start:68 stop:703 length:636 start_codon:yes stop_codon:yes gene_type:complete
MPPVKDMQPKLIPILVSIVVLLCGCTTPVDVNQSEEIPLQMSFVAKTLDRSEDGGAEYNLKENLEEKPVLILWIAAGCSGCHDWTQLIRESTENGSLDSTSVNIISIHRWAEIESTTQIMDVFGIEENNSNYSPWPVIIPSESDMIIDFTTGLTTDFTIYEGFNNPGTPTVQLVGQDGIKMWQSKSYWANFSMLQEAWNVAEIISEKSATE